MRRFVISILIILLILSTWSAVLADSISSKNYYELSGISVRIDGTELNELYYNDKLSNVSLKKIDDLILYTEVVNIENIGESEFVDAIVKYNDGTFEKVSNIADWESDNPDVVFAYKGRILAVGKGSTIVRVSISNFTREIKVNVEGRTDVREVILKLDKDTDKKTNSTYLRDYVVDKAKRMVDVSWTPSQNLTGWLGRYTFTKGVTYKGIPYSQTPNQRDEIGFLQSLNNAADFYVPYTDPNGRIMPRYGSDCSGFVSFAWGISRQTTWSFLQGIKNGTYKKVGSYNVDNPTSSELLTSYLQLQRGDAVVNEGHTFLIAYNDKTNKKVYAYEQTPYYAQYTVWTYTQMADGKYRPFTLTYMDDPILPYSLFLELE
ncbi:hypothetical protein M2349_002388 [Caldanaerobacter subterraneus subsp. tengcongensis MB4]|uniref:Uncharacterized protein n=1 Tax=Caldanaerobacter subterraneus subsp. tengcongensis (strain DSM 15242 / JCM 11007 / NBRC 100824 / MB4) TaxID=273068 RepID=Q8R6N4_CALS4|nr:hypothetical protein [Caldanaerobacter subterraneus]AAM25871.1 hypothetical protein TTE2766 [Caldanaerobacter subterraneus subsp. tengcongensis MB4]MCS3917247.1 hypothetical protein [Caldanaerobacter subterraneus subsp. tengcongensis MB4]